jgi:hypothetical protein
MAGEDDLRDKLRKIEALFAGAKTPGEQAAAGAAADRIRARLKSAEASEAAVEMRFAIHDPWARQLFSALCRRYGLKPFRYPRMKRQSIVVKAPASFVETVLWPEFNALNTALAAFLSETTTRIIREEVNRDTREAEEVPEPKVIG